MDIRNTPICHSAREQVVEVAAGVHVRVEIQVVRTHLHRVSNRVDRKVWRRSSPIADRLSGRGRFGARAVFARRRSGLVAVAFTGLAPVCGPGGPQRNSHQRQMIEASLRGTQRGSDTGPPPCPATGSQSDGRASCWNSEPSPAPARSQHPRIFPPCL